MAGTIQRDVTAGLDIGTSGIAVAVLNRGCGPKPEPLGYGFCPSMGVEKGRVIDPEDTATAVKKAVNDARVAAGVPFSSVYVNVDGPDIVARNDSVKQAIARRQVIERHDLHKLQLHFCETILPANWSVVQLVNIKFYIDGKHVTRPQGCRGRELGLSATVLAIPSKQMDQICQCLRNVDLQVNQTAVGPLAAAQAVLSGVERQLGVICVDIGAGLTKTVFINHDMLYHLSIFPVGAGHITADLAVGLHTSLEAAEKVKMEYGLGVINGHVQVPNLSGAGYNTVPGELVHKIIRSRIEEILDFVKQFIEKLKLEASLPGGIVLTGGGARLVGLPELAQDYWMIPVRRGYNMLLGEDVSDNENAYRYTTAVGLALGGTGQRQVTCGVRRIVEGG